MIIILHGPDSFNRGKKLWSIAREFRAKHPLGSFSRVDLEEDGGLSRLQELTGTHSLFDPRELVILGNAYLLEKKQIQTILLPHRDSPSITVLISEEYKPPKAFDVFAKDVPIGKKTFLVQEFPNLEGAAWVKFIKKAVEEEGVKFSERAHVYLSDKYANDSWGVVTAIKKLSMLGKDIVDISDIEGADAESAPNFFGILSGLKSANLRGRLSMLERLFVLGEPAAKLFHILAYQGENAARFSRYDFAVKSGKLDYEEALLDALL